MAIQTTIANASSGQSIVCHAFNGFITRQRHQGEIAHRLGRGDTIAQSLGKRGDVCQCIARVLCADIGTATTTEDAFHALNLETAATITDDFARVIRVTIHGAVASIQIGAFGYGGVRYPYCVTCQLAVEDVGEAPSANVPAS